MSVKELFIESQKEFKRVKSLVGTSMFGAINVAVSQFNIKILPPYLSITFGFLAVSACGYLYGPLLTGAAGAILDLIKFMVKPTGPFMIGFTFVEFLGGFLYGLILYRKDVTFWRCLLAKAVVIICCNLIMTPLLLSLYYGKKTYLALLWTRIPKNLIEWPIHSALIYAILSFIKRAHIDTH